MNWEHKILLLPEHVCVCSVQLFILQCDYKGDKVKRAAPIIQQMDNFRFGPVVQGVHLYPHSLIGSLGICERP